MTTASWVYSPDSARLSLTGDWTAMNVSALRSLGLPEFPENSVIDLSGVGQIDCAGAIEMIKICAKNDRHVADIDWSGVPLSHKKLLEMVEEHMQSSVPQPASRIEWLECLGRSVVRKWTELLRFLAFLGQIVVLIKGLFRKGQRVRWPLVVRNLDETGCGAIGVIALLTFLIGVVLSYQVIVMLRRYGALDRMVGLTGVIMLREFAPVISAIVLAGRTATAFAAEIGTMAVQEEVDALTALGVNPLERLVIPKLLALMLAIPLLTMVANIASVLGCLVMGYLQAGISPESFMMRFHDAVSVTQLWVGLCKTPVFALVIALVGTHQGFSVEASALSVGRKTTNSAVQAIFLVIIVDALFSILFSMYGI